MELVFIHGWGFDARFWDAVSARLRQFPQQRVDLGFFGRASEPVHAPAVLVGHSLGFLHGLPQRNWAGWIAINSFPRFVQTPGQEGCVPPAMLREMRMRLSANPAQTLQDFHAMIGSPMPEGMPNAECLREGLDALRDGAVDENTACNIPGLVLASRKDPLVPVAASEKLGRMAQQGLWHEAGGHILPQSDPDWCAQAIENFVASFFPAQERKTA
ncbi:MAG: alpha/beta hydrolase [Alphaproteobacteria bacterium]|nr:alpha/beta hydrolase [Alphaproteobacteria bacterium]